MYRYWVPGTQATAAESISGAWTFTAGLTVSAGQKLYLGTDTWLIRSAAEELSFAVTSGTRFKVTADGAKIVNGANAGTLSMSGANILADTNVIGAGWLQGNNGVYTNDVNSRTATTVAVTSSMADGASAVAAEIDTSTAWSNGTAKLLSLRNNNVEKAYFGYDGSLVLGGNLSLGDYTGTFDTVRATNFYQEGSGPITLTGTEANGATANGVVTDTYDPLSTAGAKVLSVRNDGTESVAVTHFGGVYLVGMTTAARDALAGADLRAGTVIYNTSTNKLNFYSGSGWEAVTSA